MHSSKIRVKTNAYILQANWRPRVSYRNSPCKTNRGKWKVKAAMEEIDNTLEYNQSISTNLLMSFASCNNNKDIDIDINFDDDGIDEEEDEDALQGTSIGPNQGKLPYTSCKSYSVTHTCYQSS